MGEIEDLKKEIAQLKAQKEVRGDFEARDRERKDLQKEKFLLKHEGSIGIAKRVGTGFKRIGQGIKNAGEKTAKNQKKRKRKPIGKAANEFFGSGSSGFGNNFNTDFGSPGKKKKGSYNSNSFKLPEFKL